MKARKQLRGKVRPRGPGAQGPVEMWGSKFQGAGLQGGRENGVELSSGGLGRWITEEMQWRDLSFDRQTQPED